MSLRYEEMAAAAAAAVSTKNAAAHAHGYGIESRKFNGMCSYPTERDPYEMKMVECRLVIDLRFFHFCNKWSL